MVVGAALTGLPVRPSIHPSARPTVDTTITIRASSSTLEFEPSAIAVRQGTELHIRFINAGTLPHNLVFVRDENDIDTLAAVASKAGGSYLPLALKDRLLAYSTLASPGDTVEFSFRVPPPGEYTYVCFMSGHSNMMLGTLRSLH